MTVTDVEVHAMAHSLVEGLRRSNAEWSERHGEPSGVTDEEYLQAEREVAAAMFRLRDRVTETR